VLILAEVTFWCALGLIVYAYAGYPCALMALAWRRTRPVKKRPVTPRVSFIIAAHNEERHIAGKIENTLAQDYPAGLVEIIVASDCSTDRTDDIVRSYAPHVSLVRAPERKGKEAAQRLAVQTALGDILIFSDAATALPAGAVSTIVQNFADPTVGCVSSVDRFIDADGVLSGEGVYVRYEMWLRMLESRVNTLIGLSGSFFAARREVCGQWSADHQSDFSMLLKAVQMKFRGVLALESVGYYRNIADDRREFQRKVRTVMRGMTVLAAHAGMLNPFRYGLFSWQLASHKVCRWLVPFAMIAAAVSNLFLLAHSSVYRASLLIQSGFYVAAFGGWWTRASILRIPMFLLVANAGVFTAWLRCLRGDRVESWTPSERRGTLPRAMANDRSLNPMRPDALKGSTGPML